MKLSLAMFLPSQSTYVYLYKNHSVQGQQLQPHVCPKAHKISGSSVFRCALLPYDTECITWPQGTSDQVAGIGGLTLSEHLGLMFIIRNVHFLDISPRKHFSNYSRHYKHNLWRTHTVDLRFYFHVVPSWSQWYLLSTCTVSGNILI